MSLISKVDVALGYQYEKTVKGKTVKASPTFGRSARYTSGNLINQSEDMWWDNTPKSIGATSNYDIDLSGVESNTFGDTLVFTAIKEVYIENLSVVPGELLEIGGAANPFLLFKGADDIYELGPGGVFHVDEPSAAGKLVTAGSGDILRIRNPNAAAVTCIIMIRGIQ